MPCRGVGVSGIRERARALSSAPAFLDVRLGHALQRVRISVVWGVPQCIHTCVDALVRIRPSIYVRWKFGWRVNICDS